MPSEPSTVPIVGIGASAGGLEAFREVLRFLPDDTGMAYVLVQHLDPKHESLLPELLARVTPMDVHEAQQDMVVEANHVYVIAPNTDMTLSQGALSLLPRTEVSGQHLSIDTFFCSLAERRAAGAMGVILSGTAADGTRGLQAIKAAGGMTFAQAPLSAQFDGMPQSAIAAGSVDFIGSPEEIARELTRISRHPYIRQLPVVETEEEVVPLTQEVPIGEPEFKQILRVLHRSTNTDFTAYKPTTIKRRMERRMVLLQIDTLASYLTYLREHQIEVDALYQDVLIGVTSFFRDPATFETLGREIFPRLLATKAADSPIRVWVPGCSTGEEVYSLAMCVLEFLAERSLPVPPIQIFGTDLNPKAIEFARGGIYPPGVIGALSPTRLERFFLAVNGSYQMRKAVRDLCVFAQHNLLKDPPFSRIDLLSCQNVLIYLGQGAQRKVLQTFHYALSPQGILLLGPSETIGTASDLFAPVGEHKRQLYGKKASSAQPQIFRDLRGSIRGTGPNTDDEGNSMTYGERKEAFDLQHETDRLLASFAPASVVIDAAMEILHFRGDTHPYLRPAPGRASLNLFKMAREGLDLELRTALSTVRKSGQRVKKEGIQMSDQGMIRDITVEIIPLKASETEDYFVILFEEATAPPPRMGADRQHDRATEQGINGRRIQDVEQELESTRQEMRSIIEEFEAANEELHSANEESLSSNEELQSLNEELETSKEEIQASNEELLVVNAELQQRNTQLQDARDFADAIVETIREPLLILDDDLRVVHANEAFYHHFQVERTETEHRRIFELGEGQWNIPALRTLLVELLPANHAFVDYEVEHLFPTIGYKVMLLNAHRIDHVQRILLAMEDITERKQVEKEKQQVLEQRKEFMAIASHELKTPVTSLKGYTQVLLARFTKVGDEHSTTLLAKMNERLNKLITLINELLDVTKIEAGQFAWHTEPFDLNALARDIVEEVGQTTERHQIRIEGTLPLLASGDRERIGQVLTNLLTNALKYSPQANAIVVRLTPGTESVTVSVQDFGIGIAPEKHEHVFERFFRVSDPEHETFPGLGLGLFISAQIVKRHGGQMWVESRVGIGSTFFFTIPLQVQQEPSARWKEGEGQHA
jgi:two-component system, chemotaxis family, CheB/CheR fusion protein